MIIFRIAGINLSWIASRIYWTDCSECTDVYGLFFRRCLTAIIYAIWHLVLALTIFSALIALLKLLYLAGIFGILFDFHKNCINYNVLF